VLLVARIAELHLPSPWRVGESHVREAKLLRWKENLISDNVS
jgi:hypothetical protein